MRGVGVARDVRVVQRVGPFVGEPAVLAARDRELTVRRAHEHHRRDALILGNLRGARAGAGDQVLAERDLVGHVPVLVKDVLEELHPLRVRLRRVPHRREADGRNARLAEHFAVFLVEGVVEDDVDVQVEQGLGVELALVVVAGVHLHHFGRHLGRDCLAHGLDAGGAHAHQVGGLAVEVGQVGGFDRDLVDGDAGDLLGQDDLVARVVGDRARRRGRGLLGGLLRLGGGGAGAARAGGEGKGGGGQDRGQGGEAGFHWVLSCFRDYEGDATQN